MIGQIFGGLFLFIFMFICHKIYKTYKAGKDLLDASLDKIGDVADTIGDIVDFKPLNCPDGTIQDGLLCRTPCDADEDYDGAGLCYKKVSADYLKSQGLSSWPGGQSTNTTYGKDSKYSTIGLGGLSYVCGPGEVSHDGFCYAGAGSVVDPLDGLTKDYIYSSPGIFRLPCPSNWSWDGFGGCWSPYHDYPNGAGYPWKLGDKPFSLDQANARCESENPQGCHRANSNSIIMPNCINGTHPVGSNICATDPSWAAYDRLKSIIGTPPNTCPPGKVKHGNNMCYPKCPDGYVRNHSNLEYCELPCPPGFTDAGPIGCNRPSRFVKSVGLTVVGVCPSDYPNKKGELCYK